jgi:hypothetical protein
MAINSAPRLKSPLIVFRGINTENVFDTKRNRHIPLLGYKGKHKGFMSTSLSRSVSKGFGYNKCCMFIILIKEGTKVLYLENISDKPDEQEILLPRNSVLSIVKFGNGTVYGIVQELNN